VNLKTHAKLCLIVRKEPDGIRRYAHIGTGNYNAATSRVYTDLGLVTARPGIVEDVTNVFNYLTGYSSQTDYDALVVAPVSLRRRMAAMIDREAQHAAEGRPARIIVKLNGLTDNEMIQRLYRASQAGVRIDMLVRGICCLRSGLPGASETIRVTSIVDRFLEHSRIFYFENGGDSEIFLASADWMPRNFFRRIEVMFPIEDPRLKARIVETILPVLLTDNVKARVQRPDGSYQRVARSAEEPAVRAQVALQGQARESAREVGETPHRLFVPIVRLAGRNGGNGGQGAAARQPKRPGTRAPARKKPTPD